SCAITGDRSAASFIVLAARWNKQTKFSALAISFRSPESSPSKTANKFAKSRPKFRWTVSWSKPIAHISRRFLFEENVVSRLTRDWSPKRSLVRAAYPWKKSLAQRPQLHKNSSDLIVGRTGRIRI